MPYLSDGLFVTYPVALLLNILHARLQLGNLPVLHGLTWRGQAGDTITIAFKATPFPVTNLDFELHEELPPLGLNGVPLEGVLRPVRDAELIVHVATTTTNQVELLVQLPDLLLLVLDLHTEESETRE